MTLPYIDPEKLVGHTACGKPYTSRVTQSGLCLDVLDPRPEQICIQDIARGLAYQCRFTGQTSEFYSVAAHSCLVSLLVSPQNALAGLLHDAAEAYINDIPRPVKPLLHGYKTIEDAITKVIFSVYRLPYPSSPEIRRADAVAVCIEQSILLPDTLSWPHVLTPEQRDDILKTYGLVYPHNTSPDFQMRMFLGRFEELIYV